MGRGGSPRGVVTGHDRTVQLRTLYLDHVLPDKMLPLWNNGIARLTHVVREDQDPEEQRPRLVREFVQFIPTHLLHVDNAPTLSRFFTCRDAIDRMLLMDLIGMVPKALVVQRVNPRKENQKRLTSVRNFYKHLEARQLMKRISLTFQLTGGVEALLSEVPKEGQTPPAVRLCCNAAVLLVHERLWRIVGSMAAGDDPELDIGATVGVLLAVSMELIIRMRRFQEYPFALCRLSKKHFPVEQITHIHSFLNTPADRLDVGCGLQINRRAWECGSESLATLWLLSAPVQAMLDRLVEILLTKRSDGMPR